MSAEGRARSPRTSPPTHAGEQAGEPLGEPLLDVAGAQRVATGVLNLALADLAASLPPAEPRSPGPGLDRRAWRRSWRDWVRNRWSAVCWLRARRSSAWIELAGFNPQELRERLAQRGLLNDPAELAPSEALRMGPDEED